MGSQEVLRVLRGRWLLIVLAGLLGTAVALLMAAAQEPEYTASADVFVSVTRGQNTGDLAQGSTFSQDQARNFAAVVPREIVLGPVIKELGLQTTLEDMRKNINVDVPLNTSLITIKVTDSDPRMAARIADSVAHSLSAAVAKLSPTVSDLKGAPVRAELIESASIADEPSSPIVPLYAMLGLLAGLVLAIAYLVIVELVVARVDSTEQVEALTGSPVLASIPKDRKLGRHPIAVTALPLSLRAENIRQVRTALKFLPGEANQTFVVTSSVSGEGKSTTAANIAAAFAAEGISTCLVEADLRRPRLEGLLDLTGGPGLSDIVVGQSAITDTVQPWGPDNLQVILVGTIPPNASELLGSVRGQEALKEITEMFEVTIIDTPPLTAVTDAAIIGRMFGGVVMIVGGGKVRTSDLRQAKAALAVADVPIRGTVLNLAKDDASARPYAYSYSGRSRQTKLAAALPQGWRPVIKVGVALLTTAAVVLATLLMTSSPPSAQTGANPLPSAATTSPKKAIFVGDSLVVGTNGSGWTGEVAEALGWDETNLGLDGTGYVTSAGVKTCGADYCAPFPLLATSVIAQSPDVVVISGGGDDRGKDVSQAAQTLFTALRTALPKARIIVISPLSQATTYPADLAAVRDQIKQAAARTRVTYVDVGNPLANRADLFAEDSRPNAAGYEALALAISKAIRKV